MPAYDGAHRDCHPGGRGYGHDASITATFARLPADVTRVLLDDQGAWHAWAGYGADPDVDLACALAAHGCGPWGIAAAILARPGRPRIATISALAIAHAACDEDAV